MNSGIDKQRKALGKGLSALIPVRPAPASPTTPSVPSEISPSRLPIGDIKPNPMQPRTNFIYERLEELAASIRANGIIQPLVVRRHGGHYELVAGERRLRAAEMAGVTEVPVVVQDVANSQLLELALIENIQREDLNPIETAHAYDRLNQELGLSHEEIARRTGKDRTSVVNTIRLLKLPREIQLMVVNQKLSMGHARAILGLPAVQPQVRIAQMAVAKGLSVRQVETIVKQMTADPLRAPRSKREQTVDPNVKAAVDELERALGTRVRIVEVGDQRGRIEIEYYSQAELDRLFQHMVGSD